MAGRGPRGGVPAVPLLRPRRRERPSPHPRRAPAVRQLREELTLLQEPGSYVGEVVKAMGKKKVLVKVRRARV